MSSKSTFRDVLRHLGSNGFGPTPAIIDLLGIRQFIRFADCRVCGKAITLYRPLRSLTEADLICDSPHDDLKEVNINDRPVAKQFVHSFDLLTTESRILDMTLADVGIPNDDILSVQVAENDYRYVRMMHKGFRWCSGETGN
jgi:hypothetical protein